MEALQINPDLGKQLVGPLKGLRSLRVGNYRIIYKKEIKDLVVLVVAVGQRKDIYRKF
ncbi:MAG: type II toxin-antitoxin system RelE/ParE family toxin [Bacteroidetes bacterium]|nr:type II toxin-antitoxin system RelE/ParE family toxin [Bacteroidota bacterium]